MAALFSRQKPELLQRRVSPCRPAWCPGGRVQLNTLVGGRPARLVSSASGVVMGPLAMIDGAGTDYDVEVRPTLQQHFQHQYVGAVVVGPAHLQRGEVVHEAHRPRLGGGSAALPPGGPIAGADTGLHAGVRSTLLHHVQHLRAGVAATGSAHHRGDQEVHGTCHHHLMHP